MVLCERIVSRQDSERLTAAIDRARQSWLTYAPNLDWFRRELQQARILPSGEVPVDVVTMNSRFVLSRPQTGAEGCYTLVFPEHQAPWDGRISVLSPLGMALLGAHEGDEVCALSSTGPEVAQVRTLIYQPEAAGDGHL